MTLFASLSIFAVSLFLFVMTYRRLAMVQPDSLSKRVRMEIDGLIVEFNRTAAKHVELLEDKIQNLERAIQRANAKMIQLDDKIDLASQISAGKEVLAMSTDVLPPTEAVVQSAPSKPEIFAMPAEPSAKDPEDAHHIRRLDQFFDHLEQATLMASSHEEELGDTASRRELLMQLISQRKSRKQLMDRGFTENEINLVAFLLGKQVK